jgi:hypothetical protein
MQSTSIMVPTSRAYLSVCVEVELKKKWRLATKETAQEIDSRKSFPDFPVLMESFFLAALARQPAANPPPAEMIASHKRQKHCLCLAVSIG